MTHVHKPYAAACERNRAPILSLLKRVLTDSGTVLEIGSGTGQHVVYFARHLPHLVWQPSDVAPHLPGIRAWCGEAPLANLREPIALDVNQAPWPITQTDHVFSANTAHIMSWPEVQAMFRGVGGLLADGGYFCLYGPFNYHGEYTSDSNARFDRQLKANDAVMGLRDVEDLMPVAHAAGMTLIDDVAMPANNRTLIWRKGG